MGREVRAQGVEPRSRVRRSREAGQALVQEWRSSGQRPAQFCREHGIGTHGLQYWRRKLDAERGSEPGVTGEFLALSAPVRAQVDEREGSSSEVVLEIRAMDPVLVRISVAAGAATFVQTLRGVLEALRS
jgi:transposase-like protein